MKRQTAIATMMAVWAVVQAQAESGRAAAERAEVDAYGNPSAQNEARQVRFEPGRISIQSGATGYGLAFRLKEIGAGNSSTLVGDERTEARPGRFGDSIAYPRVGGVQETYRLTRDGVAQVFLLEPGVEGEAGRLTISGEIDGSLRGDPGRYLGAVAFRSGADAVMSYGPARAVDAEGRETPVEVLVDGNRLTLEVSGGWLRNAAHPVRVESQIVSVPSFSVRLPPPTGADENMPVWRVQLRLTTTTAASAGTDDDLKVQLNAVNGAWLDYARNDFEPGDSFYYDLSLAGVVRLKDITMLSLQKTGSDGWGLQSLALYVNGARIYSIDFGGGRWFDNNGPDTRTLVISSTVLRTSVDWKMYGSPLPPTVVSAAELKSVEESAHGNLMQVQAGGYVWGSDGEVKVVKIETDRVRTGFTVQYKQIRNYASDLLISQSSSLGVSCLGGQAFPAASATWAITYSGTGKPDPAFVNLSWDRLSQELKLKLDAIIAAMNLGGACPTFTVLSDGSIGIARP
ncbi:MAG: hypothetical protein HY013_03385 [Candidatus Solibacter usitatus]|nr:hypothetical protein [Candidatus Solibacter usitatus]